MGGEFHASYAPPFNGEENGMLISIRHRKFNTLNDSYLLPNGRFTLVFHLIPYPSMPLCLYLYNYFLS
jgi:hypothetical protein